MNRRVSSLNSPQPVPPVAPARRLRRTTPQPTPGDTCPLVEAILSPSAPRLDQLSDLLLSLYAPCAPRDFPQRALDVTRQLLPGHLLTFEQLDLTTGELTNHTSGQLALPRADFIERWQSLAQQHPIVHAHLTRGGSRTATYSLEALFPAEMRIRSAIEHELFRPLGIRQQIAVLFPITDVAAGLSISRDGEPFSEQERLLLGRLGPHLAQAHRNHLLLTPPAERPAAYRNLAWQRMRSAGFSRRECEVLQWLAEGKSDDEIALILGLSRKTVSNHVLDLLHKLGERKRIDGVNAALRIVELAPVVEFEAPPRHRDDKLQSHILALARAQWPAALLHELCVALGDLWPGAGAEACLLKLASPEAARYPAFAPERLTACADLLAAQPPESADTPPALGSALPLPDGMVCHPLSAAACVLENSRAAQGEFLTALVLLPEKVAIAVVIHTPALDRERFSAWLELCPHLLVALRSACRYATQAQHGGPTEPAPEPESACWQSLNAIGLTARQTEILAWVAAGLTDQEIATKFALSTRTVHAHLRAIFAALAVENRLAAVVEACRYFSRRAAFAPE
jgi:DNA-binding CsgD family transcriptional regulator